MANDNLSDIQSGVLSWAKLPTLGKRQLKLYREGRPNLKSFGLIHVLGTCPTRVFVFTERALQGCRWAFSAYIYMFGLREPSSSVGSIGT